jgi:ribosome-binding factor A
MPSQRAERVGRLILRELSQIVDSNVGDPRLSLVTFTDVKMTPDLRTAHVYFSSLVGADGREEAATALKKACGYIRRELGHRLSLRYVPQLRFSVDKSLDLSDRIGRLIDEPHDNDEE